ncbi:hypothetical protein JW964_16530 [candidate division KSB1 bacterium]|nr:hypothetical protein [candidate division KSB1 bacterium]
MNSPEIFQVSSTPLAHAHAHNDYMQERPLLDALKYGFCSIEVDICCFIRKLFIGHSILDIFHGKDIETQYLIPLKKIIQNNNGVLFPTNQQLIMLIDIKSLFVKSVYRKLKKVLAKYADILTSFENGIENKKPILVIISGKAPICLLEKEKIRYAGCDGRKKHLNANYPTALMPLISEDWTEAFDWNGEEKFSNSEREKLNDFCIKVHSKGRKVRFWDTPDEEGKRENVWRELLNAGVDLINTDHLSELNDFLRGYYTEIA